MGGSGKDDGERKQVTVLFADVSGSMDLAEGQDPEQWRKIMQRFFAILAAAVERFEGTVDKFTGDGIMAVFGAPVAHEDDAERASSAPAPAATSPFSAGSPTSLTGSISWVRCGSSSVLTPADPPRRSGGTRRRRDGS